MLSMIHSNKIPIVLLVFTLGMLGMWGCARKPAGRNTAQDRIQSLEGRCVQLEQDYRTVASARDQARKQLSSLEEEHGRTQKEQAREREALAQQLKASQEEAALLRKQLAERTQERDGLLGKVADRTTERDGLQNRVDRLRKGLQSLLSLDDGQPPAESGATPTTAPTCPNSSSPAPTGASPAAPAAAPQGGQ
jgi:hypothetical protein